MIINVNKNLLQIIFCLKTNIILLNDHLFFSHCLDRFYPILFIAIEDKQKKL